MFLWEVWYGLTSQMCVSMYVCMKGLQAIGAFFRNHVVLAEYLGFMRDEYTNLLLFRPQFIAFAFSNF